MGTKLGWSWLSPTLPYPGSSHLGVLTEKGFPSRNQSEKSGITECPAKTFRENSRNLPVPCREGLACSEGWGGCEVL